MTFFTVQSRGDSAEWFRHTLQDVYIHICVCVSVFHLSTVTAPVLFCVSRHGSKKQESQFKGPAVDGFSAIWWKRDGPVSQLTSFDPHTSCDTRLKSKPPERSRDLAPLEGDLSTRFITTLVCLAG